MSQSEIAKALQNKRNTDKTHKVVPGTPPPLSAEVDYRKQLLGLVNAIQDQLEREIYPMLTYYEPRYIQDTPRQDILKKINAISQQLLAPINKFANITAPIFVKDVSATNRKRLQTSFEKSFGFSVPQLVKDEGLKKPLNEAIDENVKLIKTIPSEFLGRVKKIISAGMTSGQTAGDIRKQLSNEAFGISERRARLIARDQTSKINGDLTRIRALDIGSNEYIWVGRNDDLERPSHKENNGKKFSWDKKPDTGHPGEAYQCRCYAKLIIKL